MVASGTTLEGHTMPHRSREEGRPPPNPALGALLRRPLGSERDGHGGAAKNAAKMRHLGIPSFHLYHCTGTYCNLLKYKEFSSVQSAFLRYKVEVFRYKVWCLRYKLIDNLRYNGTDRACSGTMPKQDYPSGVQLLSRVRYNGQMVGRPFLSNFLVEFLHLDAYPLLFADR